MCGLTLPRLSNNLYQYFTDAVPELKEEKSQSPPKPRSGAVAETFRIVKDSLSDDVVKATQAIYQFELSGKDAIWECGAFVK